MNNRNEQKIKISRPKNIEIIMGIKKRINKRPIEIFRDICPDAITLIFFRLGLILSDSTS